MNLRSSEKKWPIFDSPCMILFTSFLELLTQNVRIVTCFLELLTQNVHMLCLILFFCETTDWLLLIFMHGFSTPQPKDIKYNVHILKQFNFAGTLTDGYFPIRFVQ